MDISQFVYGYLYPFLYDVIHAAGGDDNAVSGVYDFIHGLLTNDITGLAVPLMFGPIAVWFALKYSLSTILQYVSDVVNFVQTAVIPIWQAVIDDLNYLIQWVDSAAGLIAQIAANIFGQLAAPWLAAWRWANWLWDNASGFLASFILDTFQFLRSYVWPMIQAFFAPYAAAVNWLVTLFQMAAGFLLRFVSDPIGFIAGVAQQVFNALLAPYQSMLQFLAWLDGQAKPILVSLVNDPSRFIFDLLAPRFLEWTIDLIASNW